jgi:hypothetical protein
MVSLAKLLSPLPNILIYESEGRRNMSIERSSNMGSIHEAERAKLQSDFIEAVRKFYQDQGLSLQTPLMGNLRDRFFDQDENKKFKPYLDGLVRHLNFYLNSLTGNSSRRQLPSLSEQPLQ